MSQVIKHRLNLLIQIPIKHLLFLLIPIIGCGVFEDLSKVNSGTFIDARNGQTYKWIRLKDGKKWMTENLNYETYSSWCYDEKSSNCTKYGRLYTWQAAKKACPSGWRLPTDDEWRKMVSCYGYGKVISKSKNNTKEAADNAAYKSLIKGGDSGFSTLFRGYRSPRGIFNGLSDIDLYWSSTEQSSTDAWRYSFSSSRKNLGRYYYDKNWAFSCRCLQG